MRLVYKRVRRDMHDLGVEMPNDYGAGVAASPMRQRDAHIAPQPAWPHFSASRQVGQLRISCGIDPWISYRQDSFGGRG